MGFRFHRAGGLRRRAATASALGLLGLSLSLGACQTTRQARSVEPSGFLGDYSMLQEGAKGEALLVYIAPGVDWKSYDKVLLDSVTIWGSEDSSLKDAPKDQLQHLTDLFYKDVYDELAKDYKMVDQPGPGTLRIRLAITEAKGSMVVLDTITSVVPQLRIVTTLGQFALGNSLITGKAAAEVEVADSMTGRRLGAAVDRSYGAKALRGVWSKWDDVDRAFADWAERLRVRLASLREGKTVKE